MSVEFPCPSLALIADTMNESLEKRVAEAKKNENGWERDLGAQELQLLTTIKKIENTTTTKLEGSTCSDSH